MDTHPGSPALATSITAVGQQPVALRSYLVAHTAADGFTYFEVRKVFGTVQIPSADSNAPTKAPFSVVVTAHGAYFSACGKVPTRALLTWTREGCKWALEQAADLWKALRKLAAIVGGATAISFVWPLPPHVPPQSEPGVAAPIVCHALPSVCAKDKGKSA